MKELLYGASLFTEAARGFLRAKGTQHAAALSFFSLFSLAPVLVLVTGLLSLIYGEQVAHQELYVQLQTVLMPDTAAWLDQLVADSAQRDAGLFATITSFLVMLVASTGAFLQLQASLNAFWEVAPRPHGVIVALLWKRAASFFLVAALGLLMVGTVTSVVVLSWASQFMPERFQADLHTIFLTERVLTYGVMTMMLALAYKLLPDAKVAWQDVLFASVTSATLLALGKHVIHVYMQTRGVSSIFGAAGSLVVVLLFVYYASMIVLFGAELAKVRAARRGQPIEPAWYAARVRVELYHDIDDPHEPIPGRVSRFVSWARSRIPGLDRSGTDETPTAETDASNTSSTT